MISTGSVAIIQLDWDLHILLEIKRNNNLKKKTLTQVMSYLSLLSVATTERLKIV